MARLTSKARNSLSKSHFALPQGTKKSSKPAFPIENLSHAEDALREVGRSLKAHDITPAEAREVRRKAKAAERKDGKK